MNLHLLNLSRPLSMLLVALWLLGGGAVEAKKTTQVARFHNVNGSRVKLSRFSRLVAAWRASKEADLVGVKSKAFRRVFMPAWKKLAPKNVKPFFVGGSGSETNNAVLHELAAQTVKRRLPSDQRGTFDPRQAKTLVLDGAFVARNGPLSEVGFQRASKSEAKRDVLESVLHQKLEEGRPGEREHRVLAKLESRLKNDPTVGALLLEPIPSAHGVLFYRPEFLRRVRQLCDTHNVPLVFDEVYTAGGVSGKFFAYQNYGVEPDFVTFGKGLVPGGAGVARVERSGRRTYDIPAGLLGFKVDPAMLHKAAMVMKRIHRGGLIEKVAAKGRILLEGLGRLQGDKSSLTVGHDGRREGGDVRGIGLLIHAGPVKDKEGRALSRLQPPLDTSARDLKRFVRELAGN